MTTVRKSSVMVPGRSDGGGGGPKLSLATIAPKTPVLPKTPSSAKGGADTPPTGAAERKMSSLLSRKLTMSKDNASTGDAAGSEDACSSAGGGAGAKKNSIMSGMFSRPSVSSGSNPRMSLVGLMASRRFAKKLMGRAIEKRESTIGDGPPPVNYEPTYRLEPKSKFDTAKVMEAVKDVIDNRLQDMKYNKRIAPNMNRILGDEVKDRVKKLNFDRYKVVVVVMIGEKKGQGIMVSSRCSWDDHLDNFVSHTFQNKHLFCTCSVYGVYHE